MPSVLFSRRHYLLRVPAPQRIMRNAGKRMSCPLVEACKRNLTHTGTVASKDGWPSRPCLVLYCLIMSCLVCSAGQFHSIESFISLSDTLPFRSTGAEIQVNDQVNELYANVNLGQGHPRQLLLWQLQVLQGSNGDTNSKPSPAAAHTYAC